MHSSAAINSQGRYSKTDSDWVSMFLSFISWGKKNSESDSNYIVSVFIIVAVVWTLLLFNIERFLELYL